MKKLLTALSTVLILSGCVTVTPGLVHRTELNTTTTTGTGEAIYSYQHDGDISVDGYNGNRWYSTTSVKQELLYSGVDNGSLKIMYREFSNDYARPAFSQEASYSVKDLPTVISFKGAKVNVIKATNVSITYTVRSGFSNETAMTIVESKK